MSRQKGHKENSAGQNKRKLKRMCNAETAEVVSYIQMGHAQQNGNFVTIVRSKIILWSFV